MLAESLVKTPCVVCGGERQWVVCPSHEVRAHMEYLRRFHRRRLKHPSPEALEDRADFTQDYATDIVSCPGCGLVFRNPRPTLEAIAEAYAADTYGHRRLAEMWDSQVELYRPKAAWLHRRLPRDARVIEVGSFVGGFLEAGRRRGWRMLGADPGQEVGDFCAERGLDVFPGSLAELAADPPRGWRPGAADCVAIWNTFDQLPDPAETVAAARQWLRPGGVLALRVPNGACFRWVCRTLPRLPWPLAGWLRAALAWNNLLAFPYLNGYDIPSLDRLMRRYGFTRVQVRRDVLTRLSDSDTKPWAAAEERAAKLACRVAAWIAATRGHNLAPWMDVLYRV